MSIHPRAQVPTETNVLYNDCDLPKYPESRMRFNALYDYVQNSEDWVSFECSSDVAQEFNEISATLTSMGLRFGESADLNQGCISSIMEDHSLVWSFMTIGSTMSTYIHIDHKDSAALLKLTYQ